MLLINRWWAHQIQFRYIQSSRTHETYQGGGVQKLDRSESLAMTFPSPILIIREILTLKFSSLSKYCFLPFAGANSAGQRFFSFFTNELSRILIIFPFKSSFLCSPTIRAIDPIWSWPDVQSAHPKLGSIPIHLADTPSIHSPDPTASHDTFQSTWRPQASYIQGCYLSIWKLWTSFEMFCKLAPWTNANQMKMKPPRWQPKLLYHCITPLWMHARWLRGPPPCFWSATNFRGEEAHQQTPPVFYKSLQYASLCHISYPIHFGPRPILLCYWIGGDSSRLAPLHTELSNTLQLIYLFTCSFFSDWKSYSKDLSTKLDIQY